MESAVWWQDIQKSSKKNRERIEKKRKIHFPYQEENPN